MFQLKNSTNFVEMNEKHNIFSEINSIPLKSIRKTGYIKNWLKHQKEYGRIYNFDSLKLTIFVYKAKYYYKQKGIKFHHIIFNECRMKNNSWIERAFQQIEKTEVMNDCNKFNLTRKTLNSDSYENLILNYGLEEGEKLYQQKCQRLKGESNPAYNHGGKFSPFSENFIHYQNENVEYTIDDVIEKSNQTKEEHPERQPTRIEYWLNLGYNEGIAKEKLSEFQTKFSLEKCKERYGDEEGYIIWKKRQEKWQETLNSKSEEELRKINKRKGHHFSNGVNFQKVLSNKNLINDKGIVYWIRIFNNDIEYWKIGITKNTVEGRFGKIEIFENKYDLKYEILDTYEDNWLNCLLIEQQILKNNYKNRIKIEYNGFSTHEAFDKPVINNIKDNMNKNKILMEREKFLESHNLKEIQYA